MAIRGQFVWEELTTTDLASASAFYAAVTGLTTAPAPFDATYTLLVGKAGPMGGLFPLPEAARAMGAPPNWLMYVGTPNVDKTVKQAASLGARVLKEPTDIPQAGRFAVDRKSTRLNSSHRT